MCDKNTCVEKKIKPGVKGWVGLESVFRFIIGPRVQLLDHVIHKNEKKMMKSIVECKPRTA